MKCELKYMKHEFMVAIKGLPLYITVFVFIVTAAINVFLDKLIVVGLIIMLYTSWYIKAHIQCNQINKNKQETRLS